MIIILECLKGVSISLPYRKILNNTQIWQNKGDTIGTIAIPSISLQTYDPSQSQKNLAKTCKPITSYYPHQNRAILIVCSGFPKFYIHFLCLKLTKSVFFTNYKNFNGKNLKLKVLKSRPKSKNLLPHTTHSRIEPFSWSILLLRCFISISRA